MQRKAKLTDIARMDNISPSAVSMALNNRPGVSEKTRERVRGIALGGDMLFVVGESYQPDYKEVATLIG